MDKPNPKNSKERSEAPCRALLKHPANQRTPDAQAEVILSTWALRARTISRALVILVMALLAGPSVAQSTIPSLYTLSSTGWQRNSTPDGEVFTCSVCEALIQVQIGVGPLLTGKAPFRTNEQFLALFRTPAQQRAFAENMLKSQIPLQSGYTLAIERTGLTKLGGIDAFQFMALVKLGTVPTNDTTIMLVHKQRLVKISLNYNDGSFNDKARSAVNALFSSIKFQ